MIKFTSRSKVRVIRLLAPPTSKTGLDRAAPRNMTVRALIHHQQHAGLRTRFTIAQTTCGHLLSVHNLERLGYDCAG